MRSGKRKSRRSSPDGNKKRNAAIVSVNDKQDGTNKNNAMVVVLDTEKQGGSVSKKDKAITVEEEDSDAPEVMSKKTAFNNYRRGNPSLRKRTRTSKNPYRCPDMEAEWTAYDDAEYHEWLLYEQKTRSLTPHEEAYFVTEGVNGRYVGNTKRLF